MLSLSIVLFFVALCTAWVNEFPIIAPSTVDAGTSFEVTISDTSIHNDATTWVESLRIYLAASAEDKLSADFYHSDCTLIKAISVCDPSITVYDQYVQISNTTYKVTIPANIGPSGPHYVLKSQLIQTDGSRYGAELSSDVFDLTSATGNWAYTQLQGYTLWSADGVPCTGFPCVKNCSEAAHNAYQKSNNASDSAYQDCANSCPGVNINFNSTQQPTQPTSTPSPCPARASTSAALLSGSTRTKTATLNSATPTSAALSTKIFSNSYVLLAIALALIFLTFRVQEVSN
ncbi:uncharacterized protein BDZ99DRAFT_569069 [Mytilinidion resinicola]|uniref:Uncharacterized protein n=1 Tax=Mytilinidion resinicola TaxID=574789 RepID=A0A6A6YUC6_9PEZI|nr:uncharacterized protein BDZ99DRAFT_569069 [Mytilinidion resinicola]KAF2812381.1 hypothetical protein BDZ99DRAFT_569069 [Mytilinidion resinicola]